jgi:hypothetical protein
MAHSPASDEPGLLPAYLKESLAKNTEDPVVPIQRRGDSSNDCYPTLPGFSDAGPKCTLEAAVMDFAELAKDHGSLLPAHGKYRREVLGKKNGFPFSLNSAASPGRSAQLL